MLNAAGAMVTDNDLLAVIPAESVTVTGKLKVPGAVGIPLRTTLIGSNVKPGMLGGIDQV